MAGEYGEATEENGQIARPHYHAIIFGHEFKDLEIHSKNENGDLLYKSKELELIWQQGHCTIGAVTFESAAYVARYVMKKITGDKAKEHYESINYATGETTTRCPEYNKMSRGGQNGKGIAYGWLQKWKTDVYPSDTIVHKGQIMKPPSYYDKIFELDNPVLLNSLKEKRKDHMLKHQNDIIPSRLREREICKLAQISQLKRGLK